MLMSSEIAAPRKGLPQARERGFPPAVGFGYPLKAVKDPDLHPAAKSAGDVLHGLGRADEVALGLN